MDLLIDTHVLVWVVEGNKRLRRTAFELMTDPDHRLFVSAAIAWEFADLRSRGRLPEIADFEQVQDMLGLQILPVPPELWRLSQGLPNLHGDPVDRMLIAHALDADLTIVTADETIRAYPVRTLW